MSLQFHSLHYSLRGHAPWATSNSCFLGFLVVLKDLFFVFFPDKLSKVLLRSKLNFGIFRVTQLAFLCIYYTKSLCEKKK